MSSDTCSLCLLLSSKDAGRNAECCYQHVVDITQQVSGYLTTKCQSEDQIECLELLLESLENQCLDLKGLLKIQKRRLETKRRYKEHGNLCHQPDLEASSLTNDCQPSPVQTSPVKQPTSDQSPKRKRKKAKKSVSGATFSPPAAAEIQTTDYNDEVHGQNAKQNVIRRKSEHSNNSNDEPEIPPNGFPALTPAPDLNMSSENVSDIDVSDVDEVTYSQDDPTTFDPTFGKAEKKGFLREVGSSFATDGGENNQLCLDDDDDDNQLLDADDDDEAMLTPFRWTNQQQFVPAFF